MYNVHKKGEKHYKKVPINNALYLMQIHNPLMGGRLGTR